jgi:hypothetical protein
VRNGSPDPSDYYRRPVPERRREERAAPPAAPGPALRGRTGRHPVVPPVPDAPVRTPPETPRRRRRRAGGRGLLASAGRQWASLGSRLRPRLSWPFPSLGAGHRLRGARPSGARRGQLWTDRWAILLALLGVVLNATLAVTLWRHFETLPELIAVHFNAYGEVDLIGGKSDIFKLPMFGAAIWVANTALAVVAGPHDRVLARLVLGIGVFVQVIFGVAAWRILS